MTKAGVCPHKKRHTISCVAFLFVLGAYKNLYALFDGLFGVQKVLGTAGVGDGLAVVFFKDGDRVSGPTRHRVNVPTPLKLRDAKLMTKTVRCPL